MNYELHTDDQITVFMVGSGPEKIRPVEHHLESSKLDVEFVSTHDREFALEYLENKPVDVVLINHQLEDGTAVEFVNTCRARTIDVPFILVTDQGSEEIAARALREGFDGYRSHNELSPSALKQSIQRVIQKHTRRCKLQERARTDGLTGLLDRHTIMDHLNGELNRATRHDVVSSVMLLDVDHFKQINDQHGHVVGDKVLRYLSKLIRNTIRDSDFAGRYGGDEMLIIAPHTNLDGIRQLGERLLNRLDDQKLADFNLTSTLHPQELSLSIGCARFDGRKHSEFHREKAVNLIDHADSALYVAKEKGGGRIERRRARREPLDGLEVDIESGGDWFAGQVVDYSEKGLGVQVPAHINRDLQVRIVFDREQLNGGEGKVTGEVAWVTEKNENGVYLAGVETEQAPPAFHYTA